MRDKNKTNKEGQRQGYWEFYYRSGALGASGFFINNIRYGLFTWYLPDGKLENRLYYAQ
jgi:antitoxin component YwqK of YwqJK toxin-antitoxin module